MLINLRQLLFSQNKTLLRAFARRGKQTDEIKKGGLHYLKMLKESAYSLNQDSIPPIQKNTSEASKEQTKKKYIPDYVADAQKFKRKLRDIDRSEEQQKLQLNKTLSFGEPNKKKEKKSALQLIEQKMKGLLPANSERVDRLDNDYIAQYEAEYKLKRRIKKYREETAPPPGPDAFIKPANLKEFQAPQRLSKRLSRMGVCSRKQAERLIESGVVKVDGELISRNTLVDDKSKIEIHNRRLASEKPDSRLWLFHKPKGLICTHYDPEKRVNIFQRVRDLGLQMPHLISIGRLDLMSEGLILLTNDGDLANALEHPSSALERAYRVRVFGRMFNETKLKKIQQGMMIKSEYYGPYVAEVEKRQNTNTWLHMKLYQGKNREIRRVMEKLSLRVNRLQRVRYGPYSISQVPHPNDLVQVAIKRNVRNIVQKYYGRRVREAQGELAHVRLESNKKKKEQRKINKEEARPGIE